MKSNTTILKELYDKQIFDLDFMDVKITFAQDLNIWVPHMYHHCNNLFMPVYLFQITEEKEVKKIYL